ncbi:MAG: right-handed parallel beta-helix repeat-containing protein [Anaerolineae bacterium]|nr:right-handed parallel beta-helix repeat-containing protein [Anaerolineae bacterium]
MLHNRSTIAPFPFLRGTYTFTSTSRLLVTSANVTVQGAGTNSTILDFNSIGRGIWIDSMSLLTIADVSLLNVSSNNSGVSVLQGSSLWMEDSIIRGGNRGGIAASGDVTVLRSVIADNMSTSDGSGIRVINADLTVRDTTIDNNTHVRNGQLQYGAGIYQQGTGNLLIENSTISNNGMSPTNGLCDVGAVEIALSLDPFVDPSALTATAADIATINLNWADNAIDESDYYVERSMDGGTTWTRIATLGANTTSYTNSIQACLAATYHYRVQAYRLADNQYSAYTNIDFADALPCPTPVVPSNLTLSPFSDFRIEVRWTENDPTATNIEYERSVDGGSTWTRLLILNTNGSGVNDESVVCGQAYTYRVRAYRRLIIHIAHTPISKR